MDGVMTEAYGQRLGERLRVENAPAIVTRSLRMADIAVTEIRCDNPLPEMCGSLQQEDAFLVGLHLRDFPNREYWEDGRPASVMGVKSSLARYEIAPSVQDQPFGLRLSPSDFSLLPVHRRHGTRRQGRAAGRSKG